MCSPSRRRKSVLVIYAARRDGTGPAISDGIFQRVLGDGLGGSLDYHSEHLDLGRFNETGYQEAAWQFLLAKHRGKGFALLVAFGDQALDFLKKRRDHLAPGAPLIFMTTENRPRPANATGVIAPLSMKATLATALELQPDTQHVVVVGGASALDRTYESLARSEFKAFEGRVTLTYLNGLPMGEILATIAKLQPRFDRLLLVLHRGCRRPTVLAPAGARSPDGYSERSRLRLADVPHGSRRRRWACVEHGGSHRANG